VLMTKLTGHYAPYFWAMIVCCLVIPLPLLAMRRTRTTVWGCVTASVAVEIGMWLERYLIVVPSLSNPRLPQADVGYGPSWVEWSLLASFFAFFIFLYAVFTKFFPIISIWEIREGRESAISEATQRVQSGLPNVRPPDKDRLQQPEPPHAHPEATAAR